MNVQVCISYYGCHLTGHVFLTFINTGTAVEFRVAAVNEFGTGPYTYCTPSPELSSMMFYFGDKLVKRHSIAMS